MLYVYRYTITNLKQKDHSNKRVMSISGHKSSASLENHQRISDHEKLKMGQDLGNSLVLPANQICTTSTVPKPILQQEKNPVLNPPSLPPSTINQHKLQEMLPKQPLAIGPPSDENSSLVHKDKTLLVPLQPTFDQETAPLLGISDADLMKIVTQCKEQNQEITMTQHQEKEFQNPSGGTTKFMCTHSMSKKSSPVIPPIFTGCKIEGPITININK